MDHFKNKQVCLYVIKMLYCVCAMMLSYVAVLGFGGKFKHPSLIVQSNPLTPISTCFLGPVPLSQPVSYNS